MPKSMLGRPGDSLGIIFDFISKLRSGAITTKEVKRFLRRQDPWVNDEQPIKLKIHDAFQRLLHALEGAPSPRSYADDFLLISSFMLKHGLRAEEMEVLYVEVCPDSSKTYRLEMVVCGGARYTGLHSCELTKELYRLVQKHAPDEEKDELLMQLAKSFRAIRLSD